MHVCVPKLNASRVSTHIIRVRVGAGNKEYNDCVLGFSQMPPEYDTPNLHRVKTHKSVFMDCYGGGTYVDGFNQNNKTIRPEVGQTIRIEANFELGEVVWTVEESGEVINRASYDGLKKDDWYFTILSCYAEDTYEILENEPEKDP